MDPVIAVIGLIVAAIAIAYRFTTETDQGVSAKERARVERILRQSPPGLPATRGSSPLPRALSGSTQRITSSDAVARKAALARIDAVKLAYGEKLTDIAYVIENHALFDSDFPETVEFDVQLAACAEPESLTTTELFRATGQLEEAFHRATANAERLGLAALADQADDGRRAVGIARKAQNTAGTPEGDALLVKLRSLLDVLGIVLPPQTRQALESPIRPGIHD